jgi:hypothetical protein
MLSSQQTFRNRRPRGFVLLLFLASLIVCAAPAVGAAELKAELVKKTEEGDAVFTHLTGQVQLTYPDGQTKLLPYRSHLQPVVAGGKVFIFTTKDAKLTGIAVYDSAKGRGQTFPLPEDLKRNNYFGQPSFSPDGTKVAYYFIGGKSLANFKFGFVDRTGKVVIPPQFDWAENFSGGQATVRIGRPGTGKEKIVSVDRTGKFITEPQTPDRISPLQPDYKDNFHEGLAKVKIDNKYGFKDKEGNIVIPPRFDYGHDFSDGVAWVHEGGKWNIVDKEGKITVLPQVKYDFQLHDFSEGLAPVKAGKKWGFIDKQGQFVIPPQYYDARSFAAGLARVCVEGKWGYGKWGYIDKTGKMVVPAQYDHALRFSEGLAGVLIDGKYGFIDRTGKMIIPPQ